MIKEHSKKLNITAKYKLTARGIYEWEGNIGFMWFYGINFYKLNKNIQSVFLKIYGFNKK